MPTRAADTIDGETVPGAAEPSTPPEVYGEGVRPTEWRSPEAERKGFHLPPGFEVRLFASEPQIAKPMNMAFDESGRLWLTQTVEYPYPAADDARPRDAVMVLTDRDGDGHAEDVTTFADRLNIPIGILPYGDGCLCFSIPNILYLRDTDGDGVCDRREVVLGPFDTSRDTHGMVNAMRDGGDGWVYACHGFNNQSVVTGKDGHTVRMSSGNTFRFRPDGSRVEVVTHGQVNPFGMTEDEWGYRYSADCHSKPITQLIRDACYPSFGRPHDGLGFLPPMIDHLHGSTAICGVLNVSTRSDLIPLRGQMISGNVMTSRLNRNAIAYRGATAVGKEQPDFMTSDDSWFRPVDLRRGPDGHIYVADFYNKIIGHYEVPLAHPERDRESGRIWQIRFVGPQPESDRPQDPIDRLQSPNPAVRSRVTLRNSTELDAARALAFNQDELADARVAAIGALGRSGPHEIESLLAWMADPQPRVQLEAIRLSCQYASDSDRLQTAAMRALNSSSAHVARAAAEFLGMTENESFIRPLADALKKVSEDDVVLRQTIRIAMRNLYRAAASDSTVWQRQDEEFASIMLGIDRPEMIDGVLDFLTSHPESALRDSLVTHVARHSTEETLASCVALARSMTTGNESQLQLLDVLVESQNSSPGHFAEPITDWAQQLADDLLRPFEDASRRKNTVVWTTRSGQVWPHRKRTLASGKEVSLIDSITLGEKYVGVMRSDSFRAPESITFWLAGHNGFPDQSDHRKNSVRLIDAVTGELIDEAFPPRNDVARKVRWELGERVGQQVRIECVDRDDANAFAWIAIGRFDPAWVLDFEATRSFQNATRLVKRLGLTEFRSRLESYAKERTFPRLLRIESAAAVAALLQRHESTVLLEFLQETGGGQGNEADELISATLSGDVGKTVATVQILAKGLPVSQQRALALRWAGSGADPQVLLKICEEGWISPVALADPDVKQMLVSKLAERPRRQLERLTNKVDASSAQRDALQKIRSDIAIGDSDHANGRKVFQKNCAACHQLRGEGSVVGPQLDGAAKRSIDRLLEDIVMPDLNVDKAFRTTSFLLDDGRVIVGLVSNETEREITVVDSNGKPIQIDPDTVERRQKAERSLMPSNFSGVMTTTEFRDMLHFIRQAP